MRQSNRGSNITRRWRWTGQVMPLFERQYLTGSFYLYRSFSVIVAQPLSFTLAGNTMNEAKNEKVINQLANWITIFTGLVAIGNFGYSLIHSFTNTGLGIPSTPNIILPMKLVFFMLIETALAYAFGWLLVNIEKHGDGVPFILLFVVSVISAWTSLFNAQWVIIGQTPVNFIFWSTFTLWFFLLSLIALLIAVYLIITHSKVLLKTDEPNSALIQIGCFAVMFFIFLYGT